MERATILIATGNIFLDTWTKGNFLFFWDWLERNSQSASGLIFSRT